MTEKQKNVIAFSAGVAVGVSGYALFTRWKASRAENMVASRPVPKELQVRPCEGGVFFGNAPPGTCPKAGKQCPTYCGKPADADGNVLVIGGPGSGKTTGVVYPTLGTWPDSIVALRAEWKEFGKLCTPIGIKSCLYLLLIENMAAHVPMIPLQSCGGIPSML